MPLIANGFKIFTIVEAGITAGEGGPCRAVVAWTEGDKDRVSKTGGRRRQRDGVRAML